MNITQDNDEYFLVSLKEQIEEIVIAFRSNKDKDARKYYRKQYKELTQKYHNHTGTHVWNDYLQ